MRKCIDRAKLEDLHLMIYITNIYKTLDMRLSKINPDVLLYNGTYDNMPILPDQAIYIMVNAAELILDQPIGLDLHWDSVNPVLQNQQAFFFIVANYPDQFGTLMHAQLEAALISSRDTIRSTTHWTAGVYGGQVALLLLEAGVILAIVAGVSGRVAKMIGTMTLMTPAEIELLVEGCLQFEGMCSERELECGVDLDESCRADDEYSESVRDVEMESNEKVNVNKYSGLSIMLEIVDENEKIEVDRGRISSNLLEISVICRSNAKKHSNIDKKDPSFSSVKSVVYSTSPRKRFSQWKEIDPENVPIRNLEHSHQKRMSFNLGSPDQRYNKKKHMGVIRRQKTTFNTPLSKSSSIRATKDLKLGREYSLYTIKLLGIYTGLIGLCLGGLLANMLTTTTTRNSLLDHITAARGLAYRSNMLNTMTYQLASLGYDSLRDDTMPGKTPDMLVDDNIEYIRADMRLIEQNDVKSMGVFMKEYTELFSQSFQGTLCDARVVEINETFTIEQCHNDPVLSHGIQTALVYLIQTAKDTVDSILSTPVKDRDIGLYATRVAELGTICVTKNRSTADWYMACKDWHSSSRPRLTE